MVGFRGSRLVSVLIVALVWGFGYWVGFVSQRTDTSKQAEAPAAGTMVGAVAGSVIAGSGPIELTAPENLVAISPEYVLAHDASAPRVEGVGLLEPPLQVMTSVYTTTRSNDPVVISTKPDSAASEAALSSSVDWY